MTHTIPTGLEVRPASARWALGHVVTLALEDHWRGMRSFANAQSRCNDIIRHFGSSTNISDLSFEVLQKYLTQCAASGQLPETVHKKAGTFKVLYKVAARHGYAGPVPQVPHVNIPKQLQWWLNAETREEVARWCAMENEQTLWDVVEFICLTGVRVEEALRIERGHFMFDTLELTVPGTKTQGSQAVIPISRDAANVARRAFGNRSGLSERLFPMTYTQIWRRWSRCAAELEMPEGATLKALRRTFGRMQLLKGMPHKMIQSIYRHASYKTTDRYLTLVGGYSREEMSQWL